MLIIPREICCDLDHALDYEWLVTNGLGGYAASSISGANTRRYHGLLVAAFPTAHIVTLSKIDEELEVGDTLYRLGTNEYESGTIYPEGYLFLERVEVDGAIPTFVYHSANFTLVKTIWMEPGRNTTFVRYTLETASAPAQLTLLPLCTYRNIHTELRGAADWRFGITTQADAVTIVAHSGAVPYHLITSPATSLVPLDLWYWRFRHRIEQARGLDSVEDLYLPGLWRIHLSPHQSFTVIATTQDPALVEREGTVALQHARANTQPMDRSEIIQFFETLRAQTGA
jgi:predicted glycogen debranching enzyme